MPTVLLLCIYVVAFPQYPSNTLSLLHNSFIENVIKQWPHKTAFVLLMS